MLALLIRPSFESTIPASWGDERISPSDSHVMRTRKYKSLTRQRHVLTVVSAVIAGVSGAV